MNAIRTMAVLGFCAALAGCAGSNDRHEHVVDPGPITLAEARKGIEEGYARNRAAFLAKDVKAIMALRTDDFHTVGPDGTPKDRAAMETYTVGLLNGIDRWIEIEFTVDSLALDSKERPREAEAIMCQHLVRMALRSDNKVHQVETWATQRERWRWTPDGWKLAKVDGVRDQKRLVDGRPE
jgi:ketosteroid isomerase-like protein